MITSESDEHRDQDDEPDHLGASTHARDHVGERNPAATQTAAQKAEMKTEKASTRPTAREAVEVVVERELGGVEAAWMRGKKHTAIMIPKAITTKTTSVDAGRGRSGGRPRAGFVRIMTSAPRRPRRHHAGATSSCALCRRPLDCDDLHPPAVHEDLDGRSRRRGRR